MANKDSYSSIKDNVLVLALARWEWEGGRIERGRLPEEQDPLLQSPVNTVDSEAQHVREVVGIFASSGDLQMAIDDLLSAGFDRMDLSLLASAAAVDEKLGHRFTKVETIADDQSLPRAAYVSPEAIGDAEGGVIGALMYAMTDRSKHQPSPVFGGITFSCNSDLVKTASRARPNRGPWDSTVSSEATTMDVPSAGVDDGNLFVTVEGRRRG
jgi:hypothetical protein